MEKEAMNSYLKTVQEGKKGLKKLEQAYRKANFNMMKVLASQRELKNAIEIFDLNVKKAGKKLKPDQKAILMEVNLKFEKLDEIIEKSFNRKNIDEFAGPSDRFAEFMEKLDSIEKELSSPDCKYQSGKDIAKVLEPISAYSNRCINFNEDYKKSSADIENLIVCLNRSNEEMKTLNSNESWSEWLKNKAPEIGRYFALMAVKSAGTFLLKYGFEYFTGIQLPI